MADRTANDGANDIVNGSAHDAPNDGEAKDGAKDGAKGPDRSVLVVEDESIVAFDLADMLEDLGYRDVTVCTSFEDAERTLAERRFDVGIFDLNLHGRISQPLIDTAQEAGTAVVVASGYEARTVPLKDPRMPRLGKPYRERDIARALRAS